MTKVIDFTFIDGVTRLSEYQINQEVEIVKDYIPSEMPTKLDAEDIQKKWRVKYTFNRFLYKITYNMVLIANGDTTLLVNEKFLVGANSPTTLTINESKLVKNN